MSDTDFEKKLFAIAGENDEASTVDLWLDTGYPELNFALSSTWENGLPVGRIVEVAGPPSSGKTAIATMAMAAAQKAGGIAAFHDHERSFAVPLAEKLGLNTSRLIFKKPRTFEESVSMAVNIAIGVRQKGLIASEAPICWVFDSLASMVPQSALYDKNGKMKSAEERSMHDNTALARATSAAMPAFSQLVEENNICAIFLNQLRTKIGVQYGDPRTTPGGDAPKYYASQRLMLGASLIKKKPDPTPIGTEVTANIIKNKVARPFLSAKWRFMFQPDGTGKFDTYRSTVDLLAREGVLEKSGAYVIWNGNKYYAEALARKLEEENAWDELIDMLPKKFEPALMAEELKEE